MISTERKDPLIALDFVIRNALEAIPGSYNFYVTTFAEMPWISEIREMTKIDTGIKQLMNHKHLKKEITETFGALCLAEKAARRLPCWSTLCGDGFNFENSPSLLRFDALARLGDRLVIYDVCSGKGIASFLMTFLLPKARIVMIDFNAKIHLEHLKNSRMMNITYKHLDIYQSEFEDFLIKDTLSFDGGDSNDGIAVAFGLHLCGNLSFRLSELFNKINSLHILILSPCCMPRKGRSVRKALLAKLKRNNWCNYSFWCMNVYHSIDPVRSHKDLIIDPLVESEKSTYISSIKRSSLCMSCTNNP